MSTRRLWELQQIDLELESKRVELERVRNQLGGNDRLLAARARVAEDRERLTTVERQQRDLEAEVEDLKEKLSRLNEKLYGGKTKNPKELMGFEQEAKQVAGLIKAKEDLILNLMSEMEQYREKLVQDSRVLEQVEADWRSEREVLLQRERELTARIDELSRNRANLVASLSPDLMQLYRLAGETGRMAVVRVDRGRCQGCRIALSMVELQRVRSGALVRCSNCGRILYQE